MKEIVIPCLLIAKSGETTMLKPKADLSSVECNLVNSDGTVSNRNFTQGKMATDETFCIVKSNDELTFIPPTLVDSKFLVKYCREVDEAFKFSNKDTTFRSLFEKYYNI